MADPSQFAHKPPYEPRMSRKQLDTQYAEHSREYYSLTPREKAGKRGAQEKANMIGYASRAPELPDG